MHLMLQTAGTAGDEKNCRYPNQVNVTGPEMLAEAARFDHVCAVYKNNYRGNDNFIRSNTVVMDIDNDHTEDPQEWITKEKLEGLFGDVNYAAVPSWHDMLQKDSYGPRPRMHVYFEIAETEDVKKYAGLKTALARKYPFFDGNALDAARFIYGCEPDEVVWHEGWETIDDELEPVPEEEMPVPKAVGRKPDREMDGRIREGSRNNTMSHFAGRVLKRFGATEKAEQLFRDEARRCDPPLEEKELKTIWNSALRFFHEVIEKSYGYIPPDQYDKDFTGDPLKPEDYTDVGEAKVFAAEYEQELRFSEATDFLRYDGDAWIEDKQLAVSAMIELLDLQLADAKEQVETCEDALVETGIDRAIVKTRGKALMDALRTPQQFKLRLSLDVADKFLKFVLKRRDYKYAINAMNFTKAMVKVGVGDLDKDPELLNTPYATFNLRKGMQGDQPHDPRDLITKMTSCSPGEKGKELWQESLQLFFQGNKELIDYVQMVVGMAAVGKVYQEHLIIAYGDGANGKSTFWNTISRVLGSYSGKLSAETLTMNCKRNVKPEMAEMKGKRLIIASEMEEGMRLNTSVVKQLCSTDDIFAEKKYKAPFSFTPSHTLVLYTNHLPKVGANDDGIWRRLIVIPFNAKITGQKDIKNYSDYLYENAGGAILTWIIEGAEKAIAADFKTRIPAVVENAIREYRSENDWLGHFINDSCDVDPSYREKSGRLYQEYRAYSAQNGEYTRSTTDFYTAIENAGYVRQRTKQFTWIIGLRLKEGEDFLS